MRYYIEENSNMTQMPLEQQNSVINIEKPLAALMRPINLSEYHGQDHLVGKDGPIRKMIENDQVVSMILWGPPGSGKTTLAHIIAEETKNRFIMLSAVSSGKKDVKAVVEEAIEYINLMKKKTILFLDEIHRFNKAQQDFLLPYVENGTIILIGATTENPSFEVNSALLSRTRVFVLNQLDIHSLLNILNRTLDQIRLQHKRNIIMTDDIKNFLITSVNGDSRALLNTIELAVKLTNGKNKITLSKKSIEQALQKKSLYYDKNGEEHYNIISALHKSLRSSDPDAGLYWLARMLEAGEDPLYIARRLVRFASEDIGNADFRALLIANAVFESCEKIGLPECKVHLAQLVIYLAKAPKDNSAYTGYAKASEDALNTLNLPVPLHLRNAPTKLMKDIGYSKGYIYDHDVPGKKSGQQCMPEELKNRKYV